MLDDNRLLGIGLTFDDVLLAPRHSKVLPKDVELTSRLTRDIQLNLPLLSAAMDTVTEARLAIALAQEGGIGIIHKNMSIEQQAQEVRQVKKFESGVVKEPVTVTRGLSCLNRLKKSFRQPPRIRAAFIRKFSIAWV